MPLKAPHPRRLAAWAAIGAAVVLGLLAGLLGLLHLPAVQGAVGRGLVGEAGRALSADVEVGSLRWSLFRGTLTAENVVVRGRDGRAGTSLSVRRVRVAFSPADLLRGRIRVREAAIEAPSARLRLDAAGHLVLPFLVPASREKETKKGLPDVVVEALGLSSGRIEIDDDGPSRRRIEADGLSLSGSADLRSTAAKGSFAAERLTFSAAGKSPLGGTAIHAGWELSGGSGRVDARFEGTETGLLLALSGTLADLSSRPRYEATLKATGPLGPLAARLVPEMELSGTIDVEASARGGFAALPDVRAKAAVIDLALYGRSVSRLDLSGELNGPRLVSATAVAKAGSGSARLEVSGTLFPVPENLAFRARLDGVEVERLVGPLPGGRRIASLLSGTVAGRVAAPTLAGTTASAELSLLPTRHAPSRGIAPAGQALVRLGKGIVTVERLTLDDRGTRGELSGSWNLAGASFDGKLDLDAADVSPWLALFGLSGGGAVNARLSGSGTLQRPALEGRARARSLVVEGVRVESLSFDARLSGPDVSVSNGAVAAYGIDASVAGEGTLGAARGKTPEADLRLSGVAIRGRRLPDVAAHASFGRTVEAHLSTSDGRVTAAASRKPDGSFRADAVIDRLDIAPFAALLPPAWGGASGEVTGRAEASRETAGAPLRAALRVDQAWVAALGRRVQTARPADASLEGGLLKVSSFSIAGDDGSTFSVSGTAAPDGSVLDLAAAAKVPALQAWASFAPDSPAIGGSFSADLRVTGSLRHPRPRGRASGRLLAWGDARIEKADATFEPAPGREDATSIHLSHSGARKGELPFPDGTAEGLLAGDALTVAARTSEGNVRLSASVALSDPWPATAEVVFDAVDVGGGPMARAAGVPKDVGARVTGRVSMRGPLARPGALEAEAEFPRVEITSRQAKVVATEPVRLSLSGGRLDVRSVRLAGGSIRLDASGALPLEGRARDRLRIEASFDLAALLPFVPALDRAQGRLVANLEVTGSLSRPSFAGRVELSEGLLDGPEFPAPVEALAGVVTATEAGVALESLSARVSGGSVSASGTLGLDGGRPRRLEAAMRARDVDLQVGDDAQVRGGADLSATGTWPALALKGEVRVADATYVPTVDVIGMLKSLVSRRRQAPAGPARGARGPSPVTLALDVSILAQDAIHLDGQMADVEMGGNLHLKGTLDAPVVLGTVASTRGTVNILGSSFDLSRARLSFSNPVAIDPELDIMGTTTKGDDEITVLISGHASKAQLYFSSTSGKSQADVLRELLGSSGSGGANAIAAWSARLAAAGVASPLMGSLGQATAFRFVPLPTTAEGEDFLFSVGKDLGGGVGVTYYKGLSGETSDALELRWRLSAQTRGRLRQNQDGSLSGGFRIRHEFH